MSPFFLKIHEIWHIFLVNVKIVNKKTLVSNFQNKLLFNQTKAFKNKRFKMAKVSNYFICDANYIHYYAATKYFYFTSVCENNEEPSVVWGKIINENIK